MGCNCSQPPAGAPLSRDEGSAAVDYGAALFDSGSPQAGARRIPGENAPARPAHMASPPEDPQGPLGDIVSRSSVMFPDTDLEGLYPDRLIREAQQAARAPAAPEAPRLRPGPRVTPEPASQEPAVPAGVPRSPGRERALHSSGPSGSRRHEPERRGFLSRLASKVPLSQPAGRPPEFSIIIPNKDEGELLIRTVKSVLESEGPSFEVIVVDDRSKHPPELNGLWPNVFQIEGPGLGVAPARNAGAEMARGRYLVFLDGHVLVPPEWLTVILNAFRAAPHLAAMSPGIAVEGDPENAGYGLTWDDRLSIQWLAKPGRDIAEVPLLPGGCVAVRSDIFKVSGGFNRGFRGHGYDDQEFSLRLWLLGHRLACLGKLTVIHRFRSEFPYRVDPWQHYYNLLRMAVCHFNEERIGKVLSIVNESVDPTLLLARILTDDTGEDRRRWLQARAHDDDWFMSHFGIPF